MLFNYVIPGLQIVQDKHFTNIFFEYDGVFPHCSCTELLGYLISLYGEIFWGGEAMKGCMVSCKPKFSDDLKKYIEDTFTEFQQRQITFKK